MNNSARRIAALVAETYDGDEVAVALVDAGGGRWRVAIHFRSRPTGKHCGRSPLRLPVPRRPRRCVSSLSRRRTGCETASPGLSRSTPAGSSCTARTTAPAFPPNRIGIEIEAALAFGTGHHGTTRGCLLALDRICKALYERGRSHRILDLGTGSGVLAIAAARALHRHVLATDIDVSAVRVVRANARLNRAGGMVEVAQADGVAAPRLRAQAPFDLILANILLGPLLRLAAPLRRLTARGGRVVLSGIVPAQANAVIAAYRPFALERRLDLDGWTTLVFVRRARISPGVARRVRGS